MKEVKSVVALAAILVGFFVSVEAAHKVANEVTARHIPYAHCNTATGYNYDHRCRKQR